MLFNDCISLISETITYDDIGNEIKTETEREIYANKMSVSSTEFYNAALAGLRPAIMFEILSVEYKNELKLKHDGIKYNIIRANDRGEKTRLTCERVAANE